jgi:glycosyltransferase involved in cell wall biosynthesis
MERPWVYGGERSMYELAAAAALGGHHVELRGDLSERDLDEICEAAGARPQVDLPPRRPGPQDLVILPEGGADALTYARLALSPARLAMMVLAAPGLFGPALDPGFSPPDPLTVDIDSIALPGHFHAIRAAGFEVWTNSPALAEASRAAGVACTLLGSGQPIPFPQPGERRHEVALLSANRWAPLARSVAERVRGSVYEIPEGDRRSIVAALASTRILILPSRIEGQSRVQLEARAVGTVPVALRSNRFATGLDGAGGAVVVDSLDEMPAAIEGLLDHPKELAERSERAMRTARAQMDWNAFVERVRAAIADPVDDPAREVRAGFGEAIEGIIANLSGALTERIEAAQGAEARLEAAHAEIGSLRDALARVGEERDTLRAEINNLRDVLTRTEQERTDSLAELEGLLRRRSVRAALRLAEIAGPVMRSRRGQDDERVQEGRDPTIE